MRHYFTLPILGLLAFTQNSFSQQILWANKLDTYSSNFSIKHYFPEEIVGEPNCMPQGGDIPSSWAPAEDSKEHFIKVSFEKSVTAKQVIIVENYAPGSISKIVGYDAKGKETILKTYKPQSLGPTSRILSAKLDKPSDIKSIKLFLQPNIDTLKNAIDAIGISTDTISYVPQIYLPVDFSKDEKANKLPSTINTANNEIGPLILADGKTIFFSRASYSEVTGGEDKEEMWSSLMDENGQWSQPMKLPKPLNSGSFSFVSAITPDGNTALLGNDFDGKGNPINGCCAFSHRTAEGWTLPENIHVHNYYNVSDKVNHSLSNSKKTMIISAEREDSNGDRDLYISFLQDNGKWTQPQNLGRGVNTGADDYAPFLASDDRTLYFSTSGLPGFGKSDIYVTKRMGNDWYNWTKPQNLGSVINSANDDAYFSITASGEDAYYCSGNLNRNMDIYEINLPPSQRPHPVVLVLGKVVNGKTKEPIDSKIIYEDLSTGKEIGHAKASHKTGTYQIALPSGINYGYRATSKGFISVSQNLDLSNLTAYKEISQDLYLLPEEVGQIARLNNLFFEYNKAYLRPESTPELSRLFVFLKENPTIEIEIQGHTDSTGTDEYNQKLSEDRAKAVQSFLVSKTIEPRRLTIQAFGEKKPIADNATPEGMAQNRRVEFVIKKK